MALLLSPSPVFKKQFAPTSSHGWFARDGWLRDLSFLSTPNVPSLRFALITLLGNISAILKRRDAVCLPPVQDPPGLMR